VLLCVFCFLISANSVLDFILYLIFETTHDFDFCNKYFNYRNFYTDL